MVATARIERWPDSAALSIAVLPNRVKDKEPARKVRAIVDEVGLSANRLNVEERAIVLAGLGHGFGLTVDGFRGSADATLLEPEGAGRAIEPRPRSAG